MSGIIFERDYFIHIYETNLRKELTVPALMRYFEEMALLQSESAGVGFEYYKANDVGWVLHQFDIRINRFPTFADRVTVRTQPVSTYKFMGFRKYWILDSQNQELITADTSWLFINPKTRRPIRVNDDMKKAYGHIDIEEEKLFIQDVPALERVDHTREFDVRYSDIDVNMHVNNTHYVEWAMEALPEKIREQCLLQNIRISFRKETPMMSGIISQVQLNETPSGYIGLHNISTTDGTLRCLLLTEWKNI